MTRTALAATIGGIASALGSGKFANGAKTAAMQHLFNEEVDAIHSKKELLKLMNELQNRLNEHIRSGGSADFKMNQKEFKKVFR